MSDQAPMNEGESRRRSTLAFESIAKSLSTIAEFLFYGAKGIVDSRKDKSHK